MIILKLILVILIIIFLLICYSLVSISSKISREEEKEEWLNKSKFL
jgi:hypothetical protein